MSLESLRAKIMARAKRVSMTTILRISAAFTILGLVFMVWSLLVPTPMPVMLAMSVGQAFGTGAFMLYLIAIFIDQRRGRRARRESQQLLARESQQNIARESQPNIARESQPNIARESQPSTGEGA